MVAHVGLSEAEWALGRSASATVALYAAVVAANTCRGWDVATAVRAELQAWCSHCSTAERIVYIRGLAVTQAGAEVDTAGVAR